MFKITKVLKIFILFIIFVTKNSTFAKILKQEVKSGLLWGMYNGRFEII